MNDWVNTINTIGNKLSNLALNKIKYNLKNDKAELLTQESLDYNKIRSQLQSNSNNKKIQALKLLLKALTVGMNVSYCFTDVINCIETSNLEIKKMSYLYIEHYCLKYPDMIIMAINTFRKDCSNKNPIIRALAIRTIGNLKYTDSLEHLIDLLRTLCTDFDLYVRKAAVLTVGKLYKNNEDYIKKCGILKEIEESLLSESHPIVLVNKIIVLEQAYKELFVIDSKLMKSLVLLLPECTEFGQISIIDILKTNYAPPNKQEAQQLIEKLSRRLTHSNSGIVLSASSLILSLISYMDSPQELIDKYLIKKISPCIQVLISSETPEISFLLLQNMKHLICEYMYPNNHYNIVNDLNEFLIKFTDPPYIQAEKFDILLLVLLYQINVDKNTNIMSNVIIKEVLEYTRLTNIDLVHKSLLFIAKIIVCVDNIIVRPLFNKLLSELLDNDHIDIYHNEFIIMLSEIMYYKSDLINEVQKSIQDALLSFLTRINIEYSEFILRSAYIYINAVYNKLGIDKVMLFIEKVNDYIDINFPSFGSNSQLYAIKIFLLIYCITKEHDYVNKLNNFTNHITKLSIENYLEQHLIILESDAQALYKHLASNNYASINEEEIINNMKLLKDINKNMSSLSVVYQQPAYCFAI